MFAKDVDPKKLQAENKALRAQLNHLSEELVKANERITELQTVLNAERVDNEAKNSLLKQQRQQAESLVCDMAVREELINSLKDEIRRTDGKMQAQEAKFQAREDDLQRLIARLQGQLAVSGSPPTEPPHPGSPPIRIIESMPLDPRTSDASGDNAPGELKGRFRRMSSNVSLQPLLQRSTVLLYNVDSPMMDSQTDHIVGRAQALAGFIDSIVRLTRQYCDVGREFTDCGERLAESFMSAR